MYTSNKNLLLINPWIYDFAAFDLWSQPLGLLYIASFLRQQGFNISYIDCLRSDIAHHEQKPKKYGLGNYTRHIINKPQILSDVPRKYARYGISEEEFILKIKQSPKPDAILLTSIMTYWYLGPKRVIELVKSIYPEVPVILGGIYASLIPDHAKKVTKPDHIIEGPGEWKVLELLIHLLKLKSGEIKQYNNIDEYPYAAFNLVQNLRYICIMTARGCPYNCSFCAQKSISTKFSQRDPEKVVEEVADRYNNFGVKDFAFYDDALFINKKRHIQPILQGIINIRLPIRLHTPNGLFAREIDEELAELMYRSNFKTIRLSFETSNESRRKDMFNKISNTGMKTAVRNLIGAGFKSSDLEAYVIMGLPGQSLDEILESIIYVNNLGVQVKLASYSPIPGTLDFQRAVKSGAIPEDIDPLLTNKTIFPLKDKLLDYDTYRNVRVLTQLLNETSQRNLSPFSDNKIGNSLRRIIGKQK